MDFREILAKLDNIKSEAEKEPKRYTAQELMSQVDKIVFTKPTQSGIKYSIANRVEFKDKDVNDPKIKAQLFQAELKQSPGRLFGELAERIKPTSDEQIEISNIVGGAGYAFSSGKKPDMSVYPLLKAVIEKAIKEMHLERDPDQSEYKDDEADDEFESVQIEGDNIYHSCVKSFKHEKFGEGTVLHGEHTLSESGDVSHYDAKFVREDGSQFIVRNIPVANMKECVVVEHGHPKKKKKVKEEEIENVEETWFQGQTAVTLNGDEFYETFGWIGENDENIEEAEYQGRTVKLNKPMRGDVKKFKVYVKNPKGNTVIGNFGDPDMKIKKSNPARRRSFRARHNCDSPGPKHKARYWSCRKW